MLARPGDVGTGAANPSPDINFQNMSTGYGLVNICARFNLLSVLFIHLLCNVFSAIFIYGIDKLIIKDYGLTIYKKNVSVFEGRCGGMFYLSKTQNQCTHSDVNDKFDLCS